ncbi:MAG: hypothetical protein II313_00495, partial [Anaerotignum sp.]|nr:hypothetical protein [Anaerotignum sp.]
MVLTTAQSIAIIAVCALCTLFERAFPFLIFRGKEVPEISAPNTDIAIYWPGNGKLTVECGTITGDTALYAKSGNIVINGGEFIGNGDAKDFKHYSNGAYATGDAVVI